MADTSPSQRDDVDFSVLLEKLRSNWSSLVICVVAGLVVGVLFLHFAPTEYRAEMRVTASNNPGQETSRRLPGLGGLASIAGLSLGNASSGATPFQLYVENLTSRALANELVHDRRIMTTIFKDEWNSSESRWQKPSGFTYPIKSSLKRLAGANDSWQPPDADRLQKYLADEIDVFTPSPKDAPITIVSYFNEDAAFASYLLGRVHSSADSLVRRQAFARTKAYVDYLSRRLGTVELPEHRKAIADTLLTQEQALMLAGSAFSYSATIVQQPVASKQVAWPRPGQVIITALLVGGILGVLLAIFDVSPWPRRNRKSADAEH